MSVGTFDAFFGQAHQMAPSGGKGRHLCDEPALEVSCFGGEDHNDRGRAPISIALFQTRRRARPGRSPDAGGFRFRFPASCRAGFPSIRP